MPTYEYECQSCKKKIEVFQNMNANPLKKCSACGGSLRRLISGGAGFIFKGAGFYATDHRNNDYKEKVKKEKAGLKPARGQNCSCCSGSKNKNDKK